MIRRAQTFNFWTLSFVAEISFLVWIISSFFLRSNLRSSFWSSLSFDCSFFSFSTKQLWLICGRFELIQSLHESLRERMSFFNFSLSFSTSFLSFFNFLSSLLESDKRFLSLRSALFWSASSRSTFSISLRLGPSRTIFDLLALSAVSFVRFLSSDDNRRLLFN